MVFDHRPTCHSHTLPFASAAYNPVRTGSTAVIATLPVRCAVVIAPVFILATDPTFRLNPVPPAPKLEPEAALLIGGLSTPSSGTVVTAAVPPEPVAKPMVLPIPIPIPAALTPPAKLANALRPGSDIVTRPPKPGPETAPPPPPPPDAAVLRSFVGSTTPVRRSDETGDGIDFVLIAVVNAAVVVAVAVPTTTALEMILGSVTLWMDERGSVAIPDDDEDDEDAGVLVKLALLGLGSRSHCCCCR